MALHIWGILVTLLCATKVLWEEVLYCEPLSEEVELVCDRRLCSLCEAVERWYHWRSSSETAASEIGATPPSSPHHILTWQTGGYNDSCFLDSSLYPELADVQWYGQEKAKPGTLV